MSGATVPTFASALHVLRDRWERLNVMSGALEGLPAFPSTRIELSAAMGEIADAICALEKIAEGGRKVTAKAKAEAAQTALEPVRAAAKGARTPTDKASPNGEKKRRGRPPKARPDEPPPELFASEFADAEDDAPGEEPPTAAAEIAAPPHYEGNGAAVVSEA